MVKITPKTNKHIVSSRVTTLPPTFLNSKPVIIEDIHIQMLECFEFVIWGFKMTKHRDHVEAIVINM